MQMCRYADEKLIKEYLQDTYKIFSKWRYLSYLSKVPSAHLHICISAHLLHIFSHAFAFSHGRSFQDNSLASSLCSVEAASDAMGLPAYYSRTRLDGVGWKSRRRHYLIPRSLGYQRALVCSVLPIVRKCIWTKHHGLPCLL